MAISKQLQKAYLERQAKAAEPPAQGSKPLVMPPPKPVPKVVPQPVPVLPKPAPRPVPKPTGRQPPIQMPVGAGLATGWDLSQVPDQYLTAELIRRGFRVVPALKKESPCPATTAAKATKAPSHPAKS